MMERDNLFDHMVTIRRKFNSVYNIYGIEEYWGSYPEEWFEEFEFLGDNEFKL